MLLRSSFIKCTSGRSKFSSFAPYETVDGKDHQFIQSKFDIVEKNAAGIWVPPENPEALATAIKKLSSDNSLYHRLTTNSLAAAPHYSRSVQAAKMISVFEKTLL